MFFFDCIQCIWHVHYMYMNKIELTSSDRAFFSLVADAAYTNPFSEQRQQLDCQLAQMVGVSPPGGYIELIKQVLGQISKKKSQIQNKHNIYPLEIKSFKESDQKLMRYVFLFEEYHRNTSDFDNLISQQEKSPDLDTPVEFAKDTLKHLQSRGLPLDESVKCFALFYQIRRAYYFIHQGLVGQSPCMRSLRMALWNNIFTYDIRGYEQYLWDRMEDFATILEGPTGCGKGAAAAAIGKSCFIPFNIKTLTFESCFAQIFVPANLSQYAPALIESELFGHARGAFTGAVTDHPGLFGQCKPHGTIFLDEIGEIEQSLQVKLLKVLEERSYIPVGSYKPKRFYGRVIAATNRSLAELRQQGRFREDFYYRLCADCITVPSLSQRIEENRQELVELVEHFAQKITGRKIAQIENKVLDVIESRLGRHYGWPGNVRELAQCIRRVILSRDYQPMIAPNAAQQSDLVEGIEQCRYSANQLTMLYLKKIYEKTGSYQEVSRIAGLNWRTVKKMLRPE